MRSLSSIHSLLRSLSPPLSLPTFHQFISTCLSFFLSLDLLHFLLIILHSLLPFGHLNEHGLLMESRESTSSPSMSPTLSIIPSTFPASPSVNMSSSRSRVFPRLRASTCHSTNKHTTRPHITMLSLSIPRLRRLHVQCCYGDVYCLCIDR